MGSRRRLAVAAALLAVTVAACANGDASRNQVRDAMANAGLDDDQSNCVANRMDPSESILTQDELNDIAKESDISQLSGRSLEQDTDQDMAEFVRGVLDDCVGTSQGSADLDDKAESGDDDTD